MKQGEKLTIRRRFRASKELTWRLWDEPEQIALWQGPEGPREKSVPFERMVIADRSGGSASPLGGTITVEFMQIEDGTELWITLPCRSDERSGQYQVNDPVTDWHSRLDRLEERLSFLAAGGLALHLVRRFNASRSLVWRVWSREEDIARWFKPAGFEILAASVDFRPGGAWFSHMRAGEGTEYRLGGSYVEIMPETRIVFSQSWLCNDGAPQHQTLITVDFANDGENCRLDFRQSLFKTEAACESHVDGWSEVMAHLAEHLRRKAPIGMTTDRRDR